MVVAEVAVHGGLGGDAAETKPEVWLASDLLLEVEEAA